MLVIGKAGQEIAYSLIAYSLTDYNLSTFPKGFLRE